MRILILTQYYPPETGAPQNRLSSLAHYLKSFGNEVEVLTANPNYPRNEIYPGYKAWKNCKEIINDIPVHRTGIWVSKSKSVLARLINYFSFVFTSFFYGFFKMKKFDVIICESPPLFLGITSILLKRKWKCRFVFNVSDLWPESAEKLGIIKNKFFLNLAYRLERYIYKHADLICGQTKGIVSTIQQTVPRKTVHWYPNGAELKRFANVAPAIKDNDEFHLLYAGIIGHAQGLEVILYAAKKIESYPQIKFFLVGDGPVKQDLIDLQQNLSLTNITFIPNQPSDKIIEWLQRCDACIVPLKRIELFKGAIPSKLFEPLAIAKPILLGVEGEAKELFIDEGKAGLYFEPENADELANGILQLYNDNALTKELGANGKQYVTEFFTRDKIACEFWKVMQEEFGENKSASA